MAMHHHQCRLCFFWLLRVREHLFLAKEKAPATAMGQFGPVPARSLSKSTLQADQAQLGLDVARAGTSDPLRLLGLSGLCCH